MIILSLGRHTNFVRNRSGVDVRKRIVCECECVCTVNYLQLYRVSKKTRGIVGPALAHGELWQTAGIRFYLFLLKDAKLPKSTYDSTRFQHKEKPRLQLLSTASSPYVRRTRYVTQDLVTFRDAEMSKKQRRARVELGKKRLFLFRSKY